jgi:hypothetical protein
MPGGSHTATVGRSGVSVDLGVPFTFDPFGVADDDTRLSSQQPFQGDAATGMARRPYRRDRPLSSYNDAAQGSMTSMDRASIFSGLSSASSRGTSVPANESVGQNEC